MQSIPIGLSTLRDPRHIIECVIPVRQQGLSDLTGTKQILEGWRTKWIIIESRWIGEVLHLTSASFAWPWCWKVAKSLNESKKL
ncbi:hypothetical protein EV363DRAFT_1188822 [Boletus edulis]|nr:hypothetical protein EV363DRAFT_1188822 [Boletus edulis]